MVQVATRNVVIVSVAALLALVNMIPGKVLANIRAIAQRDIDSKLSWVETVGLHVIIIDRGELQAICLARNKPLGDLRDRANLVIVLGEDCECVANAIVPAPAVMALCSESSVLAAGDVSLDGPVNEALVKVTVFEVTRVVCQAILV